MGYVFQDLNLIPTLTAAENVALPLELDGRRRTATLARLAAAPHRVVEQVPQRQPPSAHHPAGEKDPAVGQCRGALTGASRGAP